MSCPRIWSCPNREWKGLQYIGGGSLFDCFWRMVQQGVVPVHCCQTHQALYILPTSHPQFAKTRILFAVDSTECHHGAPQIHRVAALVRVRGESCRGSGTLSASGQRGAPHTQVRGTLEPHGTSKSATPGETVFRDVRAGAVALAKLRSLRTLIRFLIVGRREKGTCR